MVHPLPFDPYLLSRAAKRSSACGCTYRSTYCRINGHLFYERPLSRHGPLVQGGPTEREKRGQQKPPPPPSSFSFNERMHLTSPKKEEEQKGRTTKHSMSVPLPGPDARAICTYSFFGPTAQRGELVLALHPTLFIKGEDFPPTEPTSRLYSTLREIEREERKGKERGSFGRFGKKRVENLRTIVLEGCKVQRVSLSQRESGKGDTF